MTLLDKNKTVELYPGVFWVGVYNEQSGLHCNPYLLIDGDEAVLIDPGSPLDFEYVLDHVSTLIPLEKIKYIVLQHQDPDLCASTPLFEAKGVKAKIATHWRAAQLIKYYGVTSPFYIVNENGFQLTFGRNRTLQFYSTPYLHFPGAIGTYDPVSKILFSSDLFGAYSHNWKLFADEADNGNSYEPYIEAMKTFHEHYMPGNDVLRPVMEMLLTMPISVIAPQHGSIIRKEIAKYIKTLRDLECGAFLHPIKKQLAQIDGYTGLCNQILKRYYATFSRQEVESIFQDANITLDQQSGLIVDYNCTGSELWQYLFQLVYSRQGGAWLSCIEPYVVKLVAEYDLKMPAIFTATLVTAEQENQQLSEENLQLKATNQRLEHSLQSASQALLKCPITQLSNENVFLEYLRTEMKSVLPKSLTGAILIISIDAMVKFNLTYGSESGDELIKSISLILNDFKHSNNELFKMDGPAFAYYLAESSIAEALQFGEQLRYAIERSDKTIGKVTVSIGVAAMAELTLQGKLVEELTDELVQTAVKRGAIARRQGGNLVCCEAQEVKLDTFGKILLVDTDEMNLDVLTASFIQSNYQVYTASDGNTALQLIAAENPDVIICEEMIPQLDGFALRERTRMSSAAKSSLFILLSHQKDDETVRRALALEIDHFFKKPYFLSEIVGIVNNYFRRSHKTDH